jgi:hypothetical protein
MAHHECGWKPATKVTFQSSKPIGLDSEGLLMEANGKAEAR